MRCSSSAAPPATGRGALERLDRNMKSGFVDRPTYRRQRAVLLTARALAARRSDRDARARSRSKRSSSRPRWCRPPRSRAGCSARPATCAAPARIVETAWKANPHPDLAETYAHLRPGDSARDRLARVQALAQMAPGKHRGRARGGARRARRAGIRDRARPRWRRSLAAPTQRVAMLMAELEELEHGDEGRAREWMARAVHARRDPAWTADGFVSDRWMPVSPVTGRLDAFQWRTPLAELEPAGAVIESKERILISAPATLAPAMPAAAAPTVRPADPLVERPPAAAAARALSGSPPPEAKRLVPAAQVPPEPDAVATLAARRRPAVVAEPPAPAAERVIPLLHVPDDPGPDLEPEEPELEPAAETPPESWTKLRGLFK